MFDNSIELHTKLGCSRKIKIVRSEIDVDYKKEAGNLYNSLINSLPHGTMVELKKLINTNIAD